MVPDCSNNYITKNSELQKFISREHELVRISQSIPWHEIREAIAEFYSPIGRPAKHLKLMIGLHILKHRYSLSDREVTNMLYENIYWQFLCDVSLEDIVISGKPILHHTCMTNFRNRLGSKGFEKIDKIITKFLIQKHGIRVRTVLVDTTAVVKNIAYPTDSALLDKGRRQLFAMIGKLKMLGVKGLDNIRSFKTLGRKTVLEIIKFGGKKMEIVKSGTLKLVKYAKSVLNRVPEALQKSDRFIRKCEACSNATLTKQVYKVREKIKSLKRVVARVITQATERFNDIHVKNKVYSIHEPGVAAISKGKRKAPTEFGSKINIAATPQGFVIAHRQYSFNINDSKTLSGILADIKVITGEYPKEVAADRGYSENSCKRKVYGLSQVLNVSIPKRGKGNKNQEASHTFKRLQRQRAGVESTIWNLKGFGIGKVRYRGNSGDDIAANMAIIVNNLKKAYNCRK